MTEKEIQYRHMHNIIMEQAKRYGDKTWMISPDQGGKKITYRQTAEWCNRIANFLKSQGIKSSDRIVLIGENSIETLLLFLGILNYGAVVSPINVEESKENHYLMINFAQPKIVFYGEEIAFDHDKYKEGKWIPYSYSGIGDGQRGDFFTTLMKESVKFEKPVGEMNEIGHIVFTSGTTALPKCVASTREAVFYMPLDTVDRLHITDKDTILDYRPYNWNSPQILSIFTSLMTGATVVYARGFSRSRFDSWLKDYAITICVGVPTVINMLMERESSLHKRDLPALRFMTSSTAPLLVRNLLEFEKKYGIPINQGAGSSETAWMAMNDPNDILNGTRKIGAIGKTLKYKEVCIIDDKGKPLPVGQEGEILVRGKARAYGYMQPDGTINKFPDDGFHTGDLGYIDKDGYLYITGRIKNQVVRGGVKISPAEITNWIIEHTGVQLAETIGVPDKVFGEDVVSFIIPREGAKLTEEDILTHCRNKLPPYKMPKAVFFMKEFPVGTTGKISRQGLLKIWEERQGKSAEGGVISYKGDK